MLAEAQNTYRFVRKTQLGPNEYRKNFHQIDREVMSVITSAEADRVTSLMSKIYLRLVNAPHRFWEREGVLRIEAEVRNERILKAWSVLCDLLGVASATASKALTWMHEQGIIGYFSGKNGVGLRIFLNRAVSSIGLRQAQASKKILVFPHASSDEVAASANEPAFNDSFAVKEVSDTDISRAPKTGAEDKCFAKALPEPNAPAPTESSLQREPVLASSQNTHAISLDDVMTRLKAELEPAMLAAARQAAAREHERTREWLENRGLPKVARVAQHEAYNVLRKYGVISEALPASRSQQEVSPGISTLPSPHPLSSDEVNDLAQICVAMLESQGQPLEATLSEMSVKAGGFILPEDSERVCQKANSLLTTDCDGRGGK